MGFGIASRLPREHQAPRRPEVIAGTLAYMAPEQTGRMNRSIDSPQRSLLAGRHPLRDAYRHAAVHGLGSDGMDPLPHRAAADAAERAGGGHSADPVEAIILKLLAKTAEDRYQTAAGVEADLRRCLAAWEARRPHRSVPARRARRAGPAADPGKALRARARDRGARRRVRSRGGRRQQPNSCWCRAIPASASPRSSTSCTRCWSRRAAFLPPASSTSTSATSPMRRWRRPSRASSAGSSAGTMQS